LTSLVGSQVGYLVCKIHMPVNAAHAAGRAGASNIDNHANLTQRILLIVSIVVDYLELPAPVFVRPVTVGAGVARRTHVLDRCFDGLGVGSESNRVKLMHPIELGLHVPLGARPNMSGDTFQTGVWRVL